MADNTLTAAGVLSNDGIFDQGHTPTGAETLVLDGNVSDGNLTFDERLPVAGAIDGVRFDNAYAGTVDAATFDVNLGSDGLDCSGGAAAELDLGSGTWTCSGDWDAEDIGTFTRGTAVVVLSGSEKTYYGLHAQRVNALTVSGTITIGTAAAVVSNGGLEVTGTLTVPAARGITSYGDITVATGSLTGDGSVAGANYGQAITGGGTWDIVATNLQYNPTINAGTYGGTWLIQHTAAGGVPANTVTIGGNITWTGDVEFRADVAATNYTIDLATHDPTITVSGDLTFTASSSGNVEISPGANGIITQGDIVRNFTSTGGLVANSCPITGAGTADRDWDGCGGEWGETIARMTGGATLTLTAAWTCSEFTAAFSSSNIDLNGQTLTASGAVSFANWSTLADPVGATIACGTFAADGQAGLNASGAWYVNAATSATISNATVAYLDASGGVEVDATDNCVEGTGCVNVKFGGNRRRRFFLASGA